MQTGELQDDRATLEALFTEYWEFVLKSLPTLATFVGDHRYDDKLDDLSQEAFDRWTRKAEDLLKRTRRIPRESLRQRDLTNCDLFIRELQQRVDAASFRPYLMPINQLAGPHIDLPQLIAITRFGSANDYENYTKRLLAFPAQVDQTISSLEEGFTHWDSSAQGGYREGSRTDQATDCVESRS